MDEMTIVIALLAAVAGLSVGILIGQREAGRRHADLRSELQALSASAVSESSDRVFAMADASFRATESVVAPVQQTLTALSSQLAGLERHEASWQAQLKQQVESVRTSGEELRAETQTLAEALRRPQVRGHWGEMQLRRSLELAGLTRHCTFEEQVTTGSEAGVLRPDAVVSLVGGKVVVIDSKTPLDAFLSAGNARTDAERAAHLRRHAGQVRQHMESLAGKSYWRQFADTPEFVVMFLPGEAIFAQALDTDPGLIDDAARRGVMLATPTTLIAMLKTISYAWSQEAVAENAREIHRTATDLYDRLIVAGRHLDKVGRSLSTAVTSYNAFVGSLEARVFVSARRLHDLDVGAESPTLPLSVSDGPRPLTATELVADRDDRVAITGPAGQEQWVRPAVGE
ncbi:MAG: DNA recombination protein RmuC [Nocardioidaceae bacterium]